tara:strand:- start:765 stop:1094 length:330 start_codon:yes stop_codon:yes gene_type:complete
MRKFILFPSYLLIIGILAIGCYNKPKQTTSAMIILNNIHSNDVAHDCKECYKKIYKTIQNSTRGILDINITQSQDGTTVLILIEYDYTYGTLNEIKKNLMLNGYQVDFN